MRGWYGFDMDGVLARHDGYSAGEIGEPIPEMVARAKALHDRGEEVRVCTARVSSIVSPAERNWQRSMIEAWCETHLGFVPPVTSEKDFAMIVLYDDRVVQVEANTGRILGRE